MKKVATEKTDNYYTEENSKDNGHSAYEHASETSKLSQKSADSSNEIHESQEKSPDYHSIEKSFTSNQSMTDSVLTEDSKLNEKSYLESHEESEDKGTKKFFL